MTLNSTDYKRTLLLRFGITTRELVQNLRRTRSIQEIVADQFERDSKRGELEVKQETEYRSSSQKSEKNQVLGES